MTRQPQSAATWWPSAVEFFVHSETATRLVALNRAFYVRHADSFAHTRVAPWPTWSFLPPFDDGTRSHPSATVLDVGCGNGRYLRFLRAGGHTGPYLGLDACGPLLTFAQADLADARGEWREVAVERSGAVTAAVGDTRFDVVVAHGVLHHIPGEAARIRFLTELMDLLAPGGRLTASLWRFRDHPRFAKHECDPLSHGFALDELEPGDALLDWQGDRSSPRYCHHFDQAEIDRLRRHFPNAELRSGGDDASDRYNAYLTLHRE